MGEILFELLFKYRPFLYERGDLAFTAPPTWVLATGAAAALIAAATYVLARGRAGAGDRAVLAGVRLALLAVLLGLLARPVLLVPTVVPQENYLAVLLDDSRSMRLEDGAARAGFVQDAFLDPASGLRRALGERFRLRYFRFSELTDRVGEDESLEFAGGRTRLGRALDRVRDELGTVPLSGVVLVTDGADDSPDELDRAITALRADALPVFAVGVGSERIRRDIEVASVSAPAAALAGSAVEADVVLAHAGFEGRTVMVQAERDGRLLGGREVRLGADGTTAVRLDFTVEEAGTHPVRFRVPVEDGEVVDRNNEREVAIGVRDVREKVLYFEGEPRHEVAFTRRAVAPDPNLQLVVLQRTDDDRYLRLAVDGPDDLVAGFPTTREELFRYRALVLGSIEASHFSHEQLEMIAEFVDRRGGGLLMLGGRRALAEGGWAGTPVGAALPVRLDPRYAADSTFLAELQVEPTRDAARHPVTRREPGDTTLLPWDRLPSLGAFNRVGPVKPGAVTLLEGTGPAVSGGQQPVLAVQRYGRGRTAVLAAYDIWTWQMHADIPPADETHQRLWRQLLRWLVAETPDPVAVQAPVEPVGSGEAFELGAVVNDDRFGGVNHARVTARVTSPTGAVAEVPLEWSLTRDGQYAGRYQPTEDGIHTIEVTARYDSVTATARPADVRVAPNMGEYFNAAMRRPLLERVAAETGGRFYQAGDTRNLPDDIAYTARGVTVIEELELWDTPAAFLLIIALLAVEWMYRRRRSLA